jgi:hypothetical protein
VDAEGTSPHRRTGPAWRGERAPSDPPPSFRRALDDPFLRGVLIVGLTAFGIGVSDVLSGPGLWHLGGAGFALLGIVIVFSLAYRYERSGLDAPRWSSSRPRRATRFILAHTWWVVLVAMLGMAAAGLVSMIT